MLQKDSILITGASGMIGAALLRTLRHDGYTNILAPRRSELDLINQKAVFAFFNKYKPQFVFHLAAIVGGIHANQTYPAKFIHDNTQMHCNIIEACYQYNVSKLLFPGSACTYPKLAQQPIKESEFLNGKMEKTNIAYGIAKANGIVMCQSYAKQYGLNVVIPMPTNAYGIGDNFDQNNGHVIPNLMTKFHNAKINKQPIVTIWGTGSILREFIYVDDFANGLIFLMQHYNSSEIINLGSGQEISIINLAKKIANIVGFEGSIETTPANPDGAPRKCLDSAKINALGFSCSINLDAGLKLMYNKHFNI